ncbi:MAG: YggS family pyridoxal phosphate-dependent enzyme [Nevskia sp.]|nr:YggS family pyridoxal phosphate-dependent enzyme [Nevskia sp.]
MSDISNNLQTLQRRIGVACARAGRSPASVQLVAVAKSVEAARLAEAAAAGQTLFGESYLQEALPKIERTEQLVGQALNWHFIGPLQANKTAAIAAHFGWVHGIDREKIARRLSAARSPAQPALQICVQVNVSGEASKSGCAPADALALCAAVSQLPQLRLRGLMTIPAPSADLESSRMTFRRLRQLADEIRASGTVPAAQFDTLSMGMSDDFEVAIEEGATLVRIGSALFGPRPK